VTKYGEDRTYKMLGRVLNDQQAQLLSSWMGRFLMWMAKILQGNEDRRQRAVFESVSRDFGPEFAPELHETPEQLRLTLRKCLYHRFFTKEGAPQLTKLFCEMDLNNFAGFSGKHRPRRKTERDSCLWPSLLSSPPVCCLPGM